MTAKIKLNAASGGGSFSLQAPSSSSNNRVFTIPDVADGTIATTATAGKILQVVSGSQQVAASVTFGTNSSPTTIFSDTGLSASITPSSSSNKVFVTGYLSYYFSMSQNGSADWNFAITDGSNNILDATSNETAGYAQNDAGGEMARRHPISFLHSPSTTSSFTYKIRMNPRNAQYSASLVAQKNGTPNNISRIILMEVAA